MKQVRNNPTSNKNITVTTYPITATSASGTVTVSTDISSLKTGDSVILGFDGGDANGFTDGSEYFLIKGTSGTFQVATTKAYAIAGTPDLTASGDAGAGDVYPNYQVGGILVANTSGDAYIRGIGVQDTGWSTFSKQSYEANGEKYPWMVKDVSASGSTITEFIAWSN